MEAHPISQEMYHILSKIVRTYSEKKTVLFIDQERLLNIPGFELYWQIHLVEPHLTYRTPSISPIYEFTKFLSRQKLLKCQVLHFEMQKQMTFEF